MEEKIYLYYTNDLHSYFINWPKVATFMKQKKEKRKMYDETYKLIDIGDHMDRVSSVTEGSLGKANVALLNDLDYDHVTIGNNEGITFPHENVYTLYDEAEFNVICSNLNCEIDANPDWLKKSFVDETKSGVKIGYVGLTAAFNPYYNLLGWHVDGSAETLKRELNELKEEADIIVLLSHVGINEDRVIAENFPEIDVIIGGHTHHLLRTGEYINETVLTAGGKFCSYVGQVLLTWDHELKKLVKKEAYTTDITYLPDDPKTVELLSKLRAKSDAVLSKEVVVLEETLEANWHKETPLMQKLTDHVKEETGSDIALLNSGLILEDFNIGRVTFKDVHYKCPHPINISIVHLKGDELKEVIRVSLTEEFINLKVRGFGFRGEILGRMIFSGIEVKTDFHEMGEYVKEITYLGKPLDNSKVYSVATADAFTFGNLLPGIARSKNKQLLLPDFIRNFLAETLKKHYSN